MLRSSEAVHMPGANHSRYVSSVVRWRHVSDVLWSRLAANRNTVSLCFCYVTACVVAVRPWEATRRLLPASSMRWHFPSNQFHGGQTPMILAAPLLSRRMVHESVLSLLWAPWKCISLVFGESGPSRRERLPCPTPTSRLHHSHPSTRLHLAEAPSKS